MPPLAAGASHHSNLLPLALALGEAGDSQGSAKADKHPDNKYQQESS